MTIDRIETAYYRLPLEPMGDAGHGAIDSEEVITVQVHADGLTGHGYAYTIGRGGRAIQSAIDHDLTPLLLDQDPTDVEALWDLMWRRLLYVGRGGLISFAIAAVDIALWDLRGLRAGRPLYQLLGGTSRPIPAYGSGVDLPKPLDALLQQVQSFLDRGLPGIKVKVGRPDPADDEARVRAVRDLIGPQTHLMLDANMGWTAAEALERGRRLEQFDLLWLEEPTLPEDVPGHAMLSASLNTPIAVGESLHSVHEFERYIREDAVGVVQIDPVTNGGITASLRALRLADAARLPTSSHYTDELSAHLLCASANPIYLEKHAFALDSYLQDPQRVVNGHVAPTETPGTGLRFDESALAPYRV
ncbi:MAG TPA: mandelate racemase/muconate lactonizing enzyme family protein [Chloroflexota bacterium]|nr:mandelate racemase/muconate lactonizing enzyme family protein [Chloroflexota bacterium]